MKILLIMVALFTYLPLGQALDMFDQDEALARQYAASTGQPYELCLRALKIAAWCKANPQGGVVNGQTYNAQATAAQLAEATRILTPQTTAKPTTAAILPPVGSNGLSNRPAVLVGRSPNDPQRIAEQKARQQRQNSNQGGNGGLTHSLRFVIEGNFAGFTGNHTFRMANGLIWQQMDGVVTQQYPVVVNPTAIISTNADGSAGILEIVGIPGSIQVMLLR